ncbi:reverse transcriptase domain-containing protein [Tanacetum coccineum]|uniref:Reverse transcriptase domain-containing protein n=1 Tax=Tanacetum coccineum TaxID=301880 RepID=A0ABQ5EFK4_9ASTR
MHTRSQTRNLHNQQHQAPPVVEQFNLEEPIENPELLAPMDDNRTMAQLLKAPTAGFEDAIVVPEITADNFELKHGLLNLVQTSNSSVMRKKILSPTSEYFNKNHINYEDFFFFSRTFRPSDQVYDQNEDFPPTVKANDAVMRNMQTQGQNMQTQLNNLATSNQRLESMLGYYHSKWCSLQGTHDSYTSSSPKKKKIKVVERETEVTKDTMLPTNNGSTEDVQPLVVPVVHHESISEPVNAPVSASRPNQKASIPFPSRRNDERRREKANDQIEKFYEIFRDLSVRCWLARTPLNENCSAVILNKLPKKLGDPGRFLIPCEFSGINTCNALADLGASINLMPYSVWKNLSLPELTPTCMTLELADRSISEPIGIAEDYVTVGKFQFPADFVVVDFEPDPRVPLILGRSFLKTINEPPKVELKDLPPHLEYAFLEGNDKLPVIIAKDLKNEEKGSSNRGIEVDRAKVDVIAKLPHPTTVKGVRSFLGHAGFYRRFIQDFSKIARPMTHLVEKETPFFFSKECIESFNTLKRKLTEAPILIAPDWDLPFELMCDAKFDVIIQDKKGAENLAADHLSRLKNPHQDNLENKEITKTFPLETLGSVALRVDSTPWFADFANYHAGNFIVNGMSSQQKNKLFKDVKHYF